MNSLTPLDGTLWLADPVHLRAVAARVLAVRTCPTARELAAERKARMEAIRRLHLEATPSKGLDHPEERLAAGKPVKAAKGKVGVLPIHGPIQQRLTSELLKAGGASTDEVSAGLDALLADPSIDTIVLHVDSPGGTSYGVEELADKIHQARERKRIYAAVDSLGASAAYWLASAAGTVVLTPGGEVGSVGVYQVHVDQSRALEAEGLTVSLISAGKYKAESASFRPLAEEARAAIQQSVDETYGKFVGALARNRGTTRADVIKHFGEGRLVSAERALEVGMVDRVLSYEGLMRRLLGEGGNASGRKAASVEVLRMRHLHSKAKSGG